MASSLRNNKHGCSMAGKNWIAGATKNSHGQFKAKAEKAGMSTEAFARKHEGASGVLGKQARLALTLMGLSHSTKNSTHAKKLYGG